MRIVGQAARDLEKKLGLPPRPIRKAPDRTQEFLDLCRHHGLPQPEPEFRFHATRRWRFDFAWPIRKFAIEVDGAVWTQGRHTRGAGVEGDMVKLAEAVCLGWNVIRVSPKMVSDGRVFLWLRRVFYGLGDDET